MRTKQNTSPHTRQKQLNYMVWSKGAVLLHSLLSMYPASVRQSCALSLLALGTLLSGCAAPLPARSLPPAPVTMPVLSEPMPSVSYQLNASKSISRWQKLLTDIPPTFKP